MCQTLPPLDRFFWSMFFFHKGDPPLSHPVMSAGAYSVDPYLNGSGSQCWDRRGMTGQVMAGTSGSGSHSGCGLTPRASKKNHGKPFLVLWALPTSCVSAPPSQKPCVDPDCPSQQSLKSGPSATWLQTAPIFIFAPPPPRPNRTAPLSLNTHRLPTLQS